MVPKVVGSIPISRPKQLSKNSAATRSFLLLRLFLLPPIATFVRVPVVLWSHTHCSPVVPLIHVHPPTVVFPFVRVRFPARIPLLDPVRSSPTIAMPFVPVIPLVVMVMVTPGADVRVIMTVCIGV